LGLGVGFLVEVLGWGFGFRFLV